VRWLNLVFVLLINAVPVYGVLVVGWSATTVLVLYWLENLLTAVATCLRIAVHRSWTQKRGHYRAGQLGVVRGKSAVTGGTFLGEYAAAAFVFTLAHGVFVGFLALMLGANRPDDPRWQFSTAQFRFGATAMAAFVAANLVTDLPSLPTRSFAWLRAYVQQRLGRVLVLHLTIIFGMLAMALTESPFGLLYVLVGLKTLVDVAGAMARDQPLLERPPAWATRLAGRIGKPAGAVGSDFAAQWRRQVEDARRTADEDDEPVRQS